MIVLLPLPLPRSCGSKTWPCCCDHIISYQYILVGPIPEPFKFDDNATYDPTKWVTAYAIIAFNHAQIAGDISGGIF